MKEHTLPFLREEGKFDMSLLNADTMSDVSGGTTQTMVGEPMSIGRLLRRVRKRERKVAKVSPS